MDIMTTQALGIGQWTATQKHDLGFKYQVPAKVGSGPKTYQYVQFVKASGPDAYRGTPAGWSAGIVDGSFTVSGDQSAVLGKVPIGVFTNVLDTAITTAYYGWIQLAVPNEVLEDVCVETGSAAGDRVCWLADSILETVAAFDSQIANVALGLVMSGVTSGHISSTGNGTGDVMVILNAGD